MRNELIKPTAEEMERMLAEDLANNVAFFENVIEQLQNRPKSTLRGMYAAASVNIREGNTGDHWRAGLMMGAAIAYFKQRPNKSMRFVV